MAHRDVGPQFSVIPLNRRLNCEVFLFDQCLSGFAYPFRGVSVFQGADNKDTGTDCVDPCLSCQLLGRKEWFVRV